MAGNVTTEAPGAAAPATNEQSAEASPDDQGDDEAPTTAASTFEELERRAAPLSDLAMLLSPFSGGCSDEGATSAAPAHGARPMDRDRCRVGREYLRHVLPQRTFSTVVDDPMAVALSDYDAGVKGFHLSVAGCLACSHPIQVGAARESRFVTVKQPAKVPGEKKTTLRAAVEVSKNAVGFDTLADAQAWRTETGSDLRAEFVFRSDPKDFAVDEQRGYALPMLGFRVFNRCTGEVLIARPTSDRVATLPGMSAGCQRGPRTGPAAAGGDSAASGANKNLPPRLSKTDINKAMGEIRAEVMACFDKFKVPGMAQLGYVVGGNGMILSVGVTGAFSGTPTGACLLEAGHQAKFPQFARDREQFTYPFFLRR